MSLLDPLNLSYTLRNLATRRTQTLLTVFGIALVVFVFIATLMLEDGLKVALASTGRPDNVIIIRTGATNEVQSGVSREHASIIESDPGIALDSSGKRLLTKDVLVLVSLKKRSDGLPSNVNLRGVNFISQSFRGDLQVVKGRAPAPGTREVMIGEAVNRKFASTEVGDVIRLAGTDWPVVGIFSAGRSAFGSEIWGDAEILLPAFRRDRFSSITFRIKSDTTFDALKSRIEVDRRLAVTVQRESSFYESQSRMLGLFIRYLGTFVSVVFSLGAIIGAMITMYSSVANRTREIGIMRAIGFSRFAIFRAFVKECLLLGLVGGIVGAVCSLVLIRYQLSTTNFATFSEIGFGFHATPGILLRGLIFSLIMGGIGGALPAWRAARLPILSALRGS